MNTDDEEQRRDRLRELQKMREQAAVQRGADVGTPSPGDDQPPGNNRRGAKLRELLQRRQAADPGNMQQAGSGRLLQALAGRGGGNAEKNQGAGSGLLRMAIANRGGRDRLGGAAAGVAADADRKAADPGNRAMLLRRIMQARKNRGGTQPRQYGEQLSELQNRVRLLTEEVERLRVTKLEQGPAADKTELASGKAEQDTADRAAQGSAAQKNKTLAQSKKPDRSTLPSGNDKDKI